MSSSTDKDKNVAQTAQEARKFLFDRNDFDAEKDRAELLREAEQRAQAAAVEKARTEGFAAGKAEGVRETAGGYESLQADILKKLSATMEQTLAQQKAREEKSYRDSIAVALAIGRKLFPALAQKLALSDTENAIRHALERRHDEPRLVIRVHETLLQPLREKIDAITASQGYAGQVILLADDRLSTTDCRVEWADGGLERSFSDLLAILEQQVQGATGAQPWQPAPPTAPETETNTPHKPSGEEP